MIVSVIRCCVLCAALGLLLNAVGCSSDTSSRPNQPVYPVSGSVMYKGKPAEGVRVSFVSTQATNKRRSISRPFTNADGKFECANDGLPAGMYEIRLTWPEERNDDQRELERDRLSGRYDNRQKAAFTVEVKPEANNLPPFELK